MNGERPAPRGRGSHLNPPNRFGLPHQVPDLEQVEHDDEYLRALENPATTYLPDASKTIVAHNDSPDVGFSYSINPYRGCLHGCSYCFARPTHEYLGLDAGLDFETKIFVKHDGPELFREFLSRPSWKPEPIVLSGVTDPYQPAEREFRITRACLEVASRARQPIGIITKNALVTRDIDLLGPMAEERLVHVNLSITTLDPELARSMEPRTSTPECRLRAVRQLSAAGIPVRVMVAPLIPGINDSEIPALLEAAKQAGAQSASLVMLRLPWAVAPVFMEWLERTQPTRRKRVEALIRGMRGGKLYDSKFGVRGAGTGQVAEQIRKMFEVFAAKHGLNRSLPQQDCSRFRAPRPLTGQLRLF